MRARKAMRTRFVLATIRANTVDRFTQRVDRKPHTVRAQRAMHRNARVARRVPSTPSTLKSLDSLKMPCVMNEVTVSPAAVHAVSERLRATSNRQGQTADIAHSVATERCAQNRTPKLTASALSRILSMPNASGRARPRGRKEMGGMDGTSGMRMMRVTPYRRPDTAARHTCHAYDAYDWTDFESDTSLLGAVFQGGGSIKGLGRHAAAALQFTSGRLLDANVSPTADRSPAELSPTNRSPANRSPVGNAVGRETVDPFRSNGSFPRVSLRHAIPTGL